MKEQQQKQSESEKDEKNIRGENKLRKMVIYLLNAFVESLFLTRTQLESAKKSILAHKTSITVKSFVFVQTLFSSPSFDSVPELLIRWCGAAYGIWC